MKTERSKHQIPLYLAIGIFVKAVGAFDYLCVNCCIESSIFLYRYLLCHEFYGGKLLGQESETCILLTGGEGRCIIAFLNCIFRNMNMIQSYNLFSFDYSLIWQAVGLFAKDGYSQCLRLA